MSSAIGPSLPKAPAAIVLQCTSDSLLPVIQAAAPLLPSGATPIIGASIGQLGMPVSSLLIRTGAPNSLPPFFERTQKISRLFVLPPSRKTIQGLPASSTATPGAQQGQMF